MCKFESYLCFLLAISEQIILYHVDLTIIKIGV